MTTGSETLQAKGCAQHARGVISSTLNQWLLVMAVNPVSSSHPSPLLPVIRSTSRHLQVSDASVSRIPVGISAFTQG